MAAHGFVHGVVHAAAQDDVVHLSQQMIDDIDFRGDFGTSQNGCERAFGIVHHLIEVVHLRLHQQAEHLVVREETGNHRRGGVFAVSGRKCVVHIHIPVGSQFACESLVTVGLLFVKTDILQQQYLTRFQLRRLRLRMKAVFGKEHLRTGQLFQVGQQELQGALFVPPLRSAQMGHEDNRTAVIQDFP